MPAKKLRSSKISVIGISILLALSACLTGCAGLTQKKSSASKTAAVRKGPAPLYHHFGDVLIPGELKVVDKSTMVVQTPEMASGILSLKGRVEKRSLVAFFNANMAKDNWKMISTFTGPESTILLFQKNNRWCVITIKEKDFNTYVEVGVAPTASEFDSGSFNEQRIIN